jgi:hypothetical protein
MTSPLPPWPGRMAVFHSHWTSRSSQKRGGQFPLLPEEKSVESPQRRLCHGKRNAERSWFGRVAVTIFCNITQQKEDYV